MKADILTIFPGFFCGPLDHGITRRASEMGLVEIQVHDLRQFTHDKHRTVDDRPFGGGEMGAAVIVEAVTRLLPGAVGNEASTRQESFTADIDRDSAGPNSTCGSGGLLDYPHYTRPAEFRGIPVPEVLMNGNHEEIRRWRRQRALEKTLRNRPDLLDGAALSEADRILLARITNDRN